MGKIVINTPSSEKPVKVAVDLNAAGLYYQGPYSITPSSTSQTFPTAGKVMSQNFTVESGFQPDYYSGPYILDVDPDVYTSIGESDLTLSDTIMVRGLPEVIPERAYFNSVIYNPPLSYYKNAKVIMDSAFFYTNGEDIILDSSTFPKCELICDNAFAHCSALKYVSLSSCKSIGYGAFGWCPNLSTVSIPNISVFAECTFQGCTSLETISFNSRIVTIAPMVFDRCHLLSSIINFTSNLRRIEDSAFCSCYNLQRVYVSGLSYVGRAAFSDCYSFYGDTTTYPGYSKSTTAGSSAWYGAGFTSSRNSYGRFWYVNCSNCSIISDYGFANCNNLDCIFLGNTGTIGCSAFRSCSMLKMVGLSKRCVSIGSYAFADCSKLHVVNFAISWSSSATYMMSTMLQTFKTGSNNIINIYSKNYNNSAITYGAGVFKNTPMFGKLNIDINNIPESMFDYESGVVTDNLYSISGANVQIIGDCAFRSRALSQANLEFPQCQQIGKSAFAFTKISAISAPLAYKINSDAFYGCSYLRTATFPTCSSIGSGAFTSCTMLSSLYLHDGLSMCILQNSNIFDGTPIASGSGTIYVPENLYSTYVSNSVWSWFSSCISIYSE